MAFTQEQAQAMYDALKNLCEMCGEANIPLVNVKAVRKMARFMDAKLAADRVLDQVRSNAATMEAINNCPGCHRDAPAGAALCANCREAVEVEIKRYGPAQKGLLLRGYTARKGFRQNGPR